MNMKKLTLAGLVLGAGLLLSACGGGGSASVLTISGTAAVGAPIVLGTVTATCKQGTGSVTSDGNGAFTVTIADGEGPCLLKIVQPNGVPLYSITSGSAARQTAHITPLTNLLVEYLSNVPGMQAADPASWFALPAARALLTDTTALATRVTQDFLPVVQALLNNAGSSTTVSLSTDFLFGSNFTPTAGNPIDDLLEELAAKNVVTATGEPAPSTATILETSASDDTAVTAPTGATGASS